VTEAAVPGSLQLIPLRGIGEVAPGDDVAAVILAALNAVPLVLRDGDIVVVTHKIISKAEGRIAAVPEDSDYRALAEAEAAAVIRRRGGLMIAITRHGFICANAGVDRSNVSGDRAVMLPIDPDASAHRIRIRLEQRTAARLAVVVTDTFGRPWRRGLTDVAIGVSGIDPIQDLRGTTDATGRLLDVTEVAIVDEIAAAADLVMGKATSIPVAVVRGLAWTPGDGRATDLVRPAGEDMFR
jgi:coenzyme F420-0:L-glutamate ligase/coenzyme F420-1:gamma-L-glutamate ligase